MKLFFFSIILSLVFHFSPSSVYAGELTILTPQDMSLVSRGQMILVVELPGQEVDELRIDVNEQQSMTVREMSGKRFLCRDDLRLELGANQISVTVFKNEHAIDHRRVSVYRQTIGSRLGRTGYQRIDFHTRKSEKLCAACHELGTDPPDQSACFACHGVMNAGPYVHEPTVTSCLTCHNPKTPLGSQSERELCGKCHMLSMEKWSGKNFEHGPLALGFCTTCHDPHASGQPLMLRMHPTDLCLACHDGFESRPHLLTTFSGTGHPLRGGSDPHNPDKPFSCASCHDPHSGNTQIFIDQYVDGGRMRFCMTCHGMH